MKTYQFKGILTNSGWLAPAFISVDENGLVTEISNANVKNTQDLEQVDGYAIPGFQNTHSHAFQYAMAGLAEKHDGPNQDDFWGWRETMYQLALSLNPDQLEAVAAMLYSEMIRHGYTQVAEFHYLHHDTNGSAYSNLGEMGSRLVAAAQKVGLKITLVPIFYQKGGFGKDPNEHQRRFISETTEDYYRLFEASEEVCKDYPGANVAYGFHSLRGVDLNDVKKVCNDRKTDIPIHIHIAEQLKEIEDCVAFTGQRPVEWLTNSVEVNNDFHLVHATHLTDEEVSAIAKSRAYVSICPSTEGNLGDGIFPLRTFQTLGGKWSIGTDSHVGLNPFEELRILDYGQRLISHKRDTFYSNERQDGGDFAIDMWLKSGRKAMGNSTEEYFAKGMPFDAIVMDAKHPMVSMSSHSSLLSTFLYSTDTAIQLGTITNGRWQVKDGVHCKREEIYHDFSRAIKEVGIR